MTDTFCSTIFDSSYIHLPISICVPKFKFHFVVPDSCEGRNVQKIIFEDVRVPAKNMIGPEGLGYRNILATLARSRIVNTAIAVGIAQRALDEAVKYSNERVTFGKPIKKHQGVQFMLADMEIQVQAARQYLLYGVRMMDAGQDIAMASSGSKVFASEAAMKVTTDAVQVLGGYGYSKEYPVEKLMRDAKIFSIFEGTNQINRMVLGGALTKI